METGAIMEGGAGTGAKAGAALNRDAGRTATAHCVRDELVSRVSPGAGARETGSHDDNTGSAGEMAGSADG